ncbi:MAG: hypothetical protein EBV03_06760 [Proteobacteria bacterium]|nr:hypothetical protein [Pseudomonadota bacterium]
MGIVLMGGTVVLAGLVWKKVSADTSGTAAVHSGCAGGDANLKGRGQVVATQIDGSKLRLTLVQASSMELVTLDVCSGKEMGAVKVQVDSLRMRN